MTLDHAKTLAEIGLFIALGSAAWYMAVKVGDAADTVNASIAVLNPLITQYTEIGSTINRPCGHGHPCGTLAETNKTMVKLQDITVTLQKQVQQSSTLVNTAASTLTTAGVSVKQTADSLSKTADGLTDLSHALTLDAQTAKTTIAAAQAVLAQFQQAGVNVNAILADSNLKATIDNVSGITGNANRISYDAKRISDDLTRRNFAPTPWWKNWRAVRSLE